MNDIAIIKQEIINQLSQVPANRLTEINHYLQFIIHQSKSEQNSTSYKSLEGIWKGLGFEKIINLDDEIDQLRKVIDNQILNKSL